MYKLLALHACAMALKLWIYIKKSSPSVYLENTRGGNLLLSRLSLHPYRLDSSSYGSILSGWWTNVGPSNYWVLIDPSCGIVFLDEIGVYIIQWSIATVLGSLVGLANLLRIWAMVPITGVTIWSISSCMNSCAMFPCHNSSMVVHNVSRWSSWLSWIASMLARVVWCGSYSWSFSNQVGAICSIVAWFKSEKLLASMLPGGSITIFLLFANWCRN